MNLSCHVCQSEHLKMCTLLVCWLQFRHWWRSCRSLEALVLTCVCQTLMFCRPSLSSISEEYLDRFESPELSCMHQNIVLSPAPRKIIAAMLLNQNWRLLWTHVKLLDVAVTRCCQMFIWHFAGIGSGHGQWWKAPQWHYIYCKQGAHKKPV